MEDPSADSIVAIVGSRAAPDVELQRAFDLARAVVGSGRFVISGGATGIDQAAARGAAEIDPTRLIVTLPWDSFERDAVPAGAEVLTPPYPTEAVELARAWLQGFDQRGRGPRALFTRNAVIARRCSGMIAFPKGRSGGTQHAMRCADALGKAVLDGRSELRVGGKVFSDVQGRTALP